MSHDLPLHLPADRACRNFTRSSLPGLRRDMNEIIGPAVAAAFDVPAAELRAPSRRSARVALARQCAMYLAHATLGWSHAAVAAACGRDRRTVAHACGVIEERREQPAFDAIVSLLETGLAAACARRQGA